MQATTTSTPTIVSASIRADQHEDLKKIAATDDRSVSSVIRTAIDEYLLREPYASIPPKGTAS